MGNGVQRVWGTWSMRPTGAKWYRGYGVHRPYRHRGQWGTGGMGHIGSEAHWGYGGTGVYGAHGQYGHRGYGVQGVWATLAIGHMANGAHGPHWQ